MGAFTSACKSMFKDAFKQYLECVQRVCVNQVSSITNQYSKQKQITQKTPKTRFMQSLTLSICRSRKNEIWVTSSAPSGSSSVGMKDEGLIAGLIRNFPLFTNLQVRVMASLGS